MNGEGILRLTEVFYTSQDMRDAALLILDQAIIQKNGINVFEELGFRDPQGNRLFVTDDSARLTKIIGRIGRGTKMYFLGNP